MPPTEWQSACREESYWGEEIPPIARPYLEKKYGAELAGRVDFCSTEPDVTSLPSRKHKRSAHASRNMVGQALRY